MDKNTFYKVFIDPKLNQFISFEFEKICQTFLINKYKETIIRIGRYWCNSKKIMLIVKLILF